MTAIAETPLFELSCVTYAYGASQPALRDCSLAIRSGSRNVLLGANGSGKTTLLQHLNALLRPTGGEIRFEGKPLDYRRAAVDALRRRVGLVFQNPDRQLFSASVAEDVSFGPFNLGLDEAAVRLRVTAALAAVDLTDEALRPVHHLSFGQKKRASIAGVLAMEPDVLLLDEPMAGLDSGMQSELLAILDRLARRGVTVVLSTHDVDFAYCWADCIHLLAAGRCVSSFAGSELGARKSELAAAGHSLPSVVALHQSLATRGVVAWQPAPRSLAELQAALDRQHRHPVDALPRVAGDSVRRSAA